MRRILTLTFSFVLAFQAIFSAYGVALALANASENGLGFIICHSGADQAPADSGTHKHPIVPCPVCAMACSASDLPPSSAFAITAPPSNVSRIGYREIDVRIAPSPGRAGLARAPPQFG